MIENAFIIPTINKPEMTLQSVTALYEQTKNFACVVVDDGSAPEHREALRAGLKVKFPDAHFVALEKNSGFSTACNTGIVYARGLGCSTYVLLNNDCNLTCDASTVISDVFRLFPRISIIGGLLKYPDGKIQHAGMEYRPRVAGAFVHPSSGKDGGVEVGISRFCVSVTGALFAIRGELYEKIGGLDESFFAACEDSDYCIRAWKADAAVWYESTLTAVHEEGATRGRTVAEKRAAHRAEWFAKESATIRAFRAKHSDADMGAIDEKVKQLNAANGLVVLPELRVELGCGANPQPGYYHIDARRMPGVDRVIDFANQKLPFNDGQAGEVLMNHSIEHISFRRLPHLLGEVRRILAPGGRFIVRTPDLRFIVETYLAKKTTPEYAPDEQYILGNFGHAGMTDKISPAWWANVKLFAGQDYPGNEHRFCFDFETLSDVLTRYGFINIVRHADRKPVFSPGEIYCEAVRK